MGLFFLSSFDNLLPNINGGDDILQVEKYTEGLLWVLQYYFSGVASWSWYANYVKELYLTVMHYRCGK